MESERETVAALSTLFGFPFGCAALLDANDECLRANGRSWSACEHTRQPADACVEAGEKRRFHLVAKCSRFKSLLESCRLQGRGTICTEQVRMLRDCADAALDHRGGASDAPPPGG